jgi:hypothetical protein
MMLMMMMKSSNESMNTISNNVLIKERREKECTTYLLMMMMVMCSQEFVSLFPDDHTNNECNHQLKERIEYIGNSANSMISSFHSLQKYNKQ